MRLVALIFAVGAVALGLASGASAGTYDVLSCGAAPRGAADDAWQSYGSTPGIALTKNCPPRDGHFEGLYAQARGGGLTAVGQEGGWRLDAPAGTQIRSFSYFRFINKFDESWSVFVRSPDDIFDTCHIIVGQGGACHRGSDLYFSENDQGRQNRTGLSVQSLSVGLRCDDPAGLGCLNGATQPEAEAGIFSSTVMIEDNVASVISSLSGSLLDGARTLKGQKQLRVTGHDITGISRARLYVDGRLAAERQGRCDFSRVVPCPNDAIEIDFDTASLSDGRHQVVVAVVDSAGNETPSAAHEVETENHRVADMRLPAPIPAPPTTSTPKLPAPAIPALPISPLPPPAGPAAPAAKPTPVHKRQAQLRIASIRRKGSRVVISGRIASSAHGKVTVSYRLHGKTRKKSVRVRGGVWKAIVVLPKGAKGKASVRAVYAGDKRFKAARATKVVRG